MSRTRLDPEGTSSRETSRRVAEALRAGDPLYSVDERALRLAAPDLILTQALCDVCAPSLGDVRAVAERLPGPPATLSLDPHTLDDVLQDIRRLGTACGSEAAAADLIDDLRSRIAAVARRAAEAAVRPATLCLEWLDPPLVAGHWVPEMVTLAAGKDILGRPGRPSRRVSPEELSIISADLAVLMPCGYHMDRTRAEARELMANPGWRDLFATRTRDVWLADGSSYFSRPGPRLVDGLELLARMLHPDLFPDVPRPSDAQRWVG